MERVVERYKVILARNPSSTVFASLAEALRRLGLVDEAIRVSLEGLNKHQDHVSGRVALGRAYYDKGMFVEARAELEKVIRVAPDNLLARRLLEDIYTRIGRSGVSLVGGDKPRGEMVFCTLTMAELLERQGYPGEALKIYEVLFEREPQNGDIQERVERLKARVRGRGVSASGKG
ncbi:MAG: tetratricopeptide repeat protein [Deltaproteobacteria bacterium]|nr:tetratricopeptide repeat protein [Deltaproteobacteria bacterium]